MSKNTFWNKLKTFWDKYDAWATALWIILTPILYVFLLDPPKNEQDLKWNGISLQSAEGIMIALAVLYWTNKRIKKTDQQIALQKRKEATDKVNGFFVKLLDDLPKLRMDNNKNYDKDAYLRVSTSLKSIRYTLNNSGLSEEEKKKLNPLDFSQQDFSNMCLKRLNFLKANLFWADLSGANLTKSNLSGADLRRANLSGANLSGVYLGTVNLSGTYLYGAIFTNAFTHLKDKARFLKYVEKGVLTQEQFEAIEFKDPSK